MSLDAGRVVMKSFFQDDYCAVCRCGPGHHELMALTDQHVVNVYCKYHKTRCGSVTRQAIEAA